jgi:hypothetical protein
LAAADEHSSDLVELHNHRFRISALGAFKRTRVARSGRSAQLSQAALAARTRASGAGQLAVEQV